MKITINVKESHFSDYAVERWHKLLESNEAKKLYQDLVHTSETCSGISSPDLLTNKEGGLNGTHFKQSNRTYDFFCLTKRECSWSVARYARRGYAAYEFTIESNS